MVLFFYPLCNTVRRVAAARNQAITAGIFAVPQRQAALAKKIFIVQTKLFQAGTGYIRQFELSLFGGTCRLAAFSYVLHSTAGRLHHLVVSSAALLNIAVTETHSHVIDQLCHLKALELAVTAVLGDEGFVRGHQFVTSWKTIARGSE